MQSLQTHAPEMKEIQKKYKGDRQKLNEEMMKFYRENNINPAASCLPLLAQLPVFFALFFVLKDFSKSPPPGPLGWLHIVPSIATPATSHWSGYLLLAIYAGSQVLLDVVHVDDDAEGAALHDARAAADLHRRRGALPGGPRPLLGDDQPVDGRPGPRHAAPRAADAARRPPARSARAEAAARRRRRQRRQSRRSAEAAAQRRRSRSSRATVKRKKGGARR